MHQGGVGARGNLFENGRGVRKFEMISNAVLNTSTNSENNEELLFELLKHGSMYCTDATYSALANTFHQTKGKTLVAFWWCGSPLGKDSHRVATLEEKSTKTMRQTVKTASLGGFVSPIAN